MKSVLKIILVLLAATYVYDCAMYYVFLKTMPKAAMMIEGAGIKVEVTNNDDWMTIAKAITAILGTYLGFKIINKYVK